MSRTYRKRRKPYYWTEKEWDADIGYMQKYCGNTRYAAVAKYYTDNERGMWQIPKQWKKEYRIRPFRGSETACLRKEMLAVEKGNILYPIKKMFDEYYW